jgi:3-methyl-2-oxobutanoate hydroxymethyltransferase
MYDRGVNHPVPHAAEATGSGVRPAMTIKTLRQMVSRGERLACLTCYDATTARWLERAGVHVLLVGDTAAEMVLGFSRTIDMPLDVLVALTAGVKRGAPRTVVMADMPFMSYQADEAEAMRNAGRFLTEGLADLVKLEVDAEHAGLVQKLTRAGVPVVAHVGSKPQQAALSGGYTGAGRSAAEAEAVLRDARELEAAGAVMLLVEAVPDEVGDRLVASAKVPVIGIGAGRSPHGQVLVLQDLLGMTDRPPVFAEPVARLGLEIQRGAEEWVRRVQAGVVGSRPGGAVTNGRNSGAGSAEGVDGASRASGPRK